MGMWQRVGRGVSGDRVRTLHETTRERLLPAACRRSPNVWNASVALATSWAKVGGDRGGKAQERARERYGSGQQPLPLERGGVLHESGDIPAHFNTSLLELLLELLPAWSTYRPKGCVHEPLRHHRIAAIERDQSLARRSSLWQPRGGGGGGSASGGGDGIARSGR